MIVLFSFGFILRSSVLDAAGTTVIATTRDATRQNEMDIPIGTSNSCTVPDVKTIGKKTQIVVTVEDVMAPATCLAPCTAALGAVIPCPLSLKMFSITTIELSTSIPMPSDRPDSVMIFSDRFEKYIRTIANNTDSGMLIATRTVGLTSFRKIARITIASSAPSTMLFTISFTIRVIY